MAGILKALTGPIKYMIDMKKEDKQLDTRLKNGLRSLKDNLEIMKAEEYDELQLQELAYDIEDFIEVLDLAVHRAPGPLLSSIGANPKDEYVHIVDYFKERIKNLEKHQQRIPDLGSPVPSPPIAEAGGSSSYTPTVDLVGVNKPIEELLQLLCPLPAEELQLRVISIVGCRGVGKTALAWAVYNDPRVAFDCTAWVEASECSQVGELLNKVLDAVKINHSTSANLHNILENKRYLVFVNDVHRAPADVWVETVDAFPKNNKSSRIIVTTSVHSVAAACSSGSYVYRMQCLGKDDSKDLFWRRVYYGLHKKPVHALAKGSKSIISKCNGLPLALISVAKHLRTKGGRGGELLESKDCETAGQTVSAFGEMRRALVQSYDSLPDDDKKTLLLYLSTFPGGHQIRRKSLLRRLKAEGLLAHDSHDCFAELIDRCFVEAVQSCSNSRDVKTCQVHGVVLEYIVQQALSKNIVTVCHEKKTLPSDSTVPSVRRLSIKSPIQNEYDRSQDKCTTRSLTMFRSGNFKFTSCKMLRLLDLEGCKHLDKKYLDGICELVLLKYLSLRKTMVKELPKHLEKLERLETLDIRDTDSPVYLDLPLEVIMLPKLAYLYGKFKLTGRPGNKKNFEEFLKNRSQLHTVAGFVINSEKCIEDTIVRHATHLKKIKLWYASAQERRYPLIKYFNFFRNGKNPVESPDPNPLTPWTDDPSLASTSYSASSTGAVQIKYIDLIPSIEQRFIGLESLSINSSQVCRDFLVSVLTGHSTITSVKLEGRLQSLPGSSILKQVPLRNNLKSLQLLSSGLSSEDLSSLQSICCLEYLKLAEGPYGFLGTDFTVRVNGFQSLKQLCFQAPTLPRLQFEQGAMKSLTTLQLLCPYSNQLKATAKTIKGITHAACLNDVVLHHSATQDPEDGWKKAIQEHPNRPCVKKQPEPKHEE